MAHPGPLSNSSSGGAWGTLDAATGKHRIGPYEVISELGRGSFAVVYHVRKIGLGREFALKVLTAARDQATQARFLREAKLASKLEHPGIVGVYDVGREGNWLYLAMEYCPGESLEERLERGPLPIDEAVALVREVALSIHVAHEQSVLHRDLKPANLILDERAGRPRITDFGLARELDTDSNLTRQGDAVGTPFYMSPEQFMAKRDLDARTDVYALGVILYQCLTGVRPFQADTSHQVAWLVCEGPKPKPPRALVPEIPKALEQACLRAMSRDRGDRFASAAELARALKPAPVSTKGLKAAKPRKSKAKAPPPPPLAARVLKPLLVVASVVVLGVAVTLAWAMSRSAPVSVVVTPTESPTPSGTPVVEPTQEALPGGVEGLLEVYRSRVRQLASLEEVLEPLDEALALVERDEVQRRRLLVEKVFLLRRRGRFEDARELAGQLTDQMDGPGLRARYELSWCTYRLGHHEQAFAGFRQLAGLDPDGAIGLTSRGTVALLLEDYPTALASMADALERDPEYVPGMVTLGFLQSRVGRGDEALQVLAKAKELYPDHQRLHRAFARVNMRLGDLQKCLSALEDAIELMEPWPHPPVIKEAMYMASEADDTQKTYEFAGRYLKTDPQDSQALVIRSMAADRLGKSMEAAEDWRRLKGSNPRAFSVMLRQAAPGLRSRIEAAVD